MGALTHTTHSILILFGVILSVNSIPYSKYGRQCSDIGCLSSQVCVMAYESCSYDQRDGKDCGRYPTCKKNTDPSVQNGNSDNSNSDTNFLNEKPTTKKPAPSFSNFDNNPNPNQDTSIFNLPTTRRPYMPPPTPPPTPAPTPAPTRPSYPSYPSGGYNGGGGQTKPTVSYGGGGIGSGGYSKPASTGSSSGSGLFGGFLSGIQTAIKGYIGNQITHQISQAIGGGAGGVGGFLDTRKLIGGSLFSENKPPSSTSSLSSNTHRNAGGVANYPTQGPVHHNPYNSYSQPNTNINNNNNYNNRGSNLPYPSSNTNLNSNRQPTPTAPSYGWKLQ